MFSPGWRPGWAAQSKLPPSTITPAIALPWPPRYLVAEYTTMAAPWSNGRTSNGAAVLSMINGMPMGRPSAATSATGNTRSFGLGSVSAYHARVRPSDARTKLSGSAGSTNRVSIPQSFSVLANRFQVPP